MGELVGGSVGGVGGGVGEGVGGSVGAGGGVGGVGTLGGSSAPYKESAKTLGSIMVESFPKRIEDNLADDPIAKTVLPLCTFTSWAHGATARIL